MKRRFLPILLILALCLGLLPATALAADGVTLRIGNTTITESGYWTTSNGGKTFTYVNGAPSSGGYIHYVPNAMGGPTLTLNNVTIAGTYDASNNIEGTGIYMSSSSGSASLTIMLQGDNNQVSGASGIYVFSGYGDASLSISGTGSLTAKGTDYGNHSGIMVQSNGGKAELTINNVDVTATNSNTQGIRLQPAGTSPATLAVNGGSLTASGSKGIDYQFGTGATGSGTPTVTVSNNAIVRANGSISNNSSTEIHIGADSSASSGGIVFGGNEGTVYGSVTLEENLTIESGQTLDIPSEASLDTNGKLTVDGGTLTQNGTVTGGVTYKVTGVSLDKNRLTLDVGGTATLAATVEPDEASIKNVTWSSENESVATVDTSGTVTAHSTGNATITATAADGSGEKATCTVTVNAAATVHVTGVSLDKTSLELTEDETARLTATVKPDDATNKDVTWASSNNDVVTVDQNGNVKAVGAGTANITVTTVDQSKTATCEVTVTAATVSVTGVTLNKTSTSLYVGDTETLTATVEPSDATNRAVTWTSSDSTVATVDQNGLVTALARGTAVITATTADGGKTASCTVTVSRYSSGGGSSSSSTSLSDRAIDDIQDARPGDTVDITLRPGRTTLEREVFEELAGQDITLEIDAGDGVLWTVNGQDIPEDTRLHDLDLDVDLGDSDIPATVLNAVTGEIDTVQLSLAHDGRFGFTMTLSAPLGRDNADYWANLYWYNERTEELDGTMSGRRSWSSSRPPGSPMTARRSLPWNTPPTMPSSSTPTATSRWSCPSTTCRRATGPMTPSSMSTARA